MILKSLTAAISSLFLIVDPAFAFAELTSGETTLKTELEVSSPTATSFRPDQSDIDVATQTFDLYFNLLSAQKFEEAFDLQTDGQKDQMGFENWKAKIASGLTGSNRIRNVHTFRITWYPDPPSGPSPGLYVALDYGFWGSGGDFQCGHIVLYEGNFKNLKVTRSDQTYIPATMMEKDWPKLELLVQLPCYLGPKIKTAFGSFAS